MIEKFKNIKYPNNEKTWNQIINEYEERFFARFIMAQERDSMQKLEARIGGFWYGNSQYPSHVLYCEKFNEEFKERVRAFWGYRCFECGTPQRKRKLSVHHVHYDKKMCCNGSPRDVVPLCSSCHTKTNTNRNYWEDHFTDLLYKYDSEGKCFFTKKEMQSISHYGYKPHDAIQKMKTVDELLKIFDEMKDPGNI